MLQVDGKVVLATRLLTELDPYIREQYKGHALECAYCKRVCIRGQNCAECDLRIHSHCVSKKFADIKNPKCPSKTCGADWPLRQPKIVQGSKNFNCFV